MNFEEFQRIQTRRSFFRDCVGGLGSIALWHLLACKGWAGDPDKKCFLRLALQPRHRTARGAAGRRARSHR